MDAKLLLKDLAEVVEVIINKEAKRQPEKRKWRDLPRALHLTQKILTHGSLKTDFLGKPECRTFVLEENVDSDSNLFGSANIEAWLHLNIINKNLTQKLRDLYSNRNRLIRHFSRDSISRNPELRQTFLQILESLELLDFERLVSLNIIRLKPTRPKSLSKTHRNKKENRETIQVNQPFSPKSKQLDLLDVVETNRPPSRYSSQPNLSIFSQDHVRARRNSFPNKKDLLVNKSESNIESALLQVPNTATRKFIRTHTRARSDTCAIIPDDTIDGSHVSGSWSRVVPASTCWTPRPRANQSLLQYLSESVVSGVAARAELDRENAHFVFAETVIYTFEEMNSDKSLQNIFENDESNVDDDDDDDEDIKKLQLEIKRKRKERKLRKQMVNSILSDGQSDTTGTTDQSASPGYTDNEADTDHVLDSNDEDFMAAETRSTDTLTDCSAECIALSLLSQVGRGRLPPADKLCWLVSRDMVDQDLLPLPSSIPVDPDQDQELASSQGHVTEIRGSLTWAPPRPQIVLTVQNVPRKKAHALSSQRWLCAGCGMKVEQKYSRSFRWCHYLGKYFCTGCHSNKSHVIPARIIQNWDFKKYPVSNFAEEILVSMKQDSVFNIQDLNPGLIKRVEKLKQVVTRRNQLSMVARYISNCRLAEDLSPMVESVLVSDTDMFSLDDMIKTRAGEMAPLLTRVISLGLVHVSECSLCQARGHICTICNSDSVIFPFMTGVHECLECYSCYHKKCFNPEQGCSKCWRKLVRNQSDPGAVF